MQGMPSSVLARALLRPAAACLLEHFSDRLEATNFRKEDFTPLGFAEESERLQAPSIASAMLVRRQTSFVDLNGEVRVVPILLSTSLTQM